MKAPGKFEYNTGKIRSFQRQRITTNITKPLSQVRICSKIPRQRAKGYYNKITKHSKSQCFQAYAQTNYSKSQKFKEPPKETCTLIVKEGLRTKEIFFEKVKITALIDSGSTVSLFERKHKQKNNGSNKIIEEQDASHRYW
ncbi:hypothetical protein TNCV_3225641 [Trichonephila clavipes]|nr:hypothetical protein TNCV_3225641 [Trichonephila clavipes]